MTDGQDLQQAAREIKAELEQLVTEMLPRLVVNAVNEYAVARETGEASRFKTLMSQLYPILDQLGQRPENDDEPGTSEHPEVAMLIPSGEVGGEASAGWAQYLPFGDKDGQALVWNEEDESWDPGEVAGGAYDGEFALFTKEVNNQTHLCMKGGTVRFGMEDLSVSEQDFGTGNKHVYLSVAFGNPSTVSVTTQSAQIPVTSDYIEIGSYVDGVITQKYLGGTGALFFLSIPNGTTAGQVLRWSGTKWEPGWVTAV